MKIFVSMIAFLIVHVASAQNIPTDMSVSDDSFYGKTYKAKVTTLYAKTVGGGITDTRYSYLQFEKDSVKITHVQLRISYREKIRTESQTSESKSYPWRLNNEEVIIENFTDYGRLIFRDGQIIGKDWFGNDLIFCIEPNQKVKSQMQ